ncbi:MAG: dockerin type I domain-containing protein [Bacillota bacterium]|nr:dockerin type I domain-containing protein [Bacillota bacterium]
MFNKRSKIICIALSIAILASMFCVVCVTASAYTSTSQNVTTGQTVIFTVTLKAGTVQLPVAALQDEIEYDPSILSFKSITYPGLSSGVIGGTPTAKADSTDNVISFNISNPVSGFPAFAADNGAAIAVVTFDVISNGSINITSFVDCAYDANFNDFVVNNATVNGAVLSSNTTVLSPTLPPTIAPTQAPTVAPTVAPTTPPQYQLGDINKDNKIDIKDATLLQKYLAKMTTLTADQLVLADVTKDGVVNIKDVTLLQKYLAKLVKGF